MAPISINDRKNGLQHVWISENGSFLSYVNFQMINDCSVVASYSSAKYPIALMFHTCMISLTALSTCDK